MSLRFVPPTKEVRKLLTKRNRDAGSENVKGQDQIPKTEVTLREWDESRATRCAK